MLFIETDKEQTVACLPGAMITRDRNSISADSFQVDTTDCNVACSLNLRATNNIENKKLVPPAKTIHRKLCLPK